jgi:hypothetical protein
MKTVIKTKLKVHICRQGRKSDQQRLYKPKCYFVYYPFAILIKDRNLVPIQNLYS